MIRFSPDFAGLPKDTPQDLVRVLRRNFEMLALAAGQGQTTSVVGIVGGGGGGSPVVPPAVCSTCVATKHLTNAWEVSEVVAVARVVFDTSEARVIFKDEDSILTDIGV